MTRQLAGAIDLGGTKILAAVVDAEGRVVAAERLPTEPERGVEAGVERMARALETACHRVGLGPGDLQGLGISAAGPLDVATGVLSSPPNLPGWRDVPLGRLLGARSGLPAILENDANAAALGEHRFGAGRGTRHMVYMTVSTGIGGGLILDGKLYRGASGAAGEIGHMIVRYGGDRCGCGREGCLEALASGTAIAREAQRAAADGRSPALAALKRTEGGLSAESVLLAAEAGDPTAATILANVAGGLGIGLLNVVHLFNPEIIVIGGGVSKMRTRVLDPAVMRMRELAFPTLAAAVRVVPAERGDDAGILGAATLVFDAQSLA